LWELSKQLRLSCCGDEEVVVKELERMEEKDMEVMKRFKEGNKRVLYDNCKFEYKRSEGRH